MEAVMETSAPPEKIWALWERAYSFNQGKVRGVRYQVLEVTPQKSFSVLWKTFFVRLVFTYSIESLCKGSKIRYSAEIRGPFKWLIHRVLDKKIRTSIALALKDMVRELETKAI